MGKSKASKRLKPSFSGEDLDSPSRAKRYALKLFSILPLGLTRVGLSISFGITGILEFRLLDLLVALFYEFNGESAISRAAFSFTSFVSVGVFLNREICRSRDSFIPVLHFPILQSKG